MLALNPVNVTAALFQVWVKVAAGEFAVSVPLLAESVVNAPVFGVVEPMAAGLDKSTGAEMKPIA